MQNLEAELAAHPHSELRVEIDYLGDNDGLVTPLGIKEGLKALFPGYLLPRDFEVERLEDLTDYYANLSREFGFEIGVPDAQLSFKGDELQERGNVEEAERLFGFLLDQNPVSVDALFRLANIYYARGEKEKALEYYKRCLEILQDVQMIRDRVEQIEKELGLR